MKPWEHLLLYGAHSDFERLPESSLYGFVEFTWLSSDRGRWKAVNGVRRRRRKQQHDVLNFQREEPSGGLAHVPKYQDPRQFCTAGDRR